MSRDFQDSPDMTQWYNVFNLEVELDIAPDGFGPFDLFQAYVRAEVRFDCIYIDGCGMWPDQPYGNNPGELPKRLSDGRARLSRGQFMIPNTRTGSNGAYPAAIQFTQDELISPDRKVVGWSGMAATRGLSRVGGSRRPDRNSHRCSLQRRRSQLVRHDLALGTLSYQLRELREFRRWRYAVDGVRRSLGLGGRPGPGHQ